MNTFWLKLASGAIGILIIIVIISMVMPNGDDNTDSTTEEQATGSFNEQVKKDKEFLEQPEPMPAPTELPIEPNVSQPKETKMTIYVKPLSINEEIEAERLLNVAVPGLSIGRLPMTGYNLMVQNCREIIKRWPDSYYAYQSKKMFGQLPERYHQQYNITPKELDINVFKTPRTGTVPKLVPIEE